MSTHGGKRKDLSLGEREEALRLLFTGMVPKAVAGKINRSTGSIHRLKQKMTAAAVALPVRGRRRRVG